MFFASVALLAASLTSCSKEETKSFTVPAKGILVATPGASGTTSFDSSNITSISATSVPTGWSVDNIDMYAGTITVTAPTSFDNEEVDSGTITLTGYTPTEATKSVSIYVAIVSDEISFYDMPANCYVATKPNTRYVFDPMRGGNGDIELQTTTVKIIWETKEGLIKYLDMRDGKATFYLEDAKEDDDDSDTGNVHYGNALIGAYDEGGELEWSWHIWVTNNDPTAAENTTTLNGQTMMTINLGAEHNSNGSTIGSKIYESYGMYYQWGRKDPFVGPQGYNFPGNHDDLLYTASGSNLNLEYVESTAEQGALSWTNANPCALVKGYKENGYDWLYDGHDDALWSSESKTNNDPCPAGWHVPDASLFENLTIEYSYDNMAWEELQKQYGLMLVSTETNAEYFFTAQGRRNYLDCRLDIVNDDIELPVPWSGYYWTSTTNDDGSATALYFDLNTATRTWNGLDTARPMHRANGMPVRCVRD